jgi:hypothetical protein
VEAMTKQTSLLDQLVVKPQRETAGSSSASRFDYQKNWAFCEMLRRHLEHADYLVAFEFHDDVVFLESSDNPTSVPFAQVKTSSSTKPRKISDLLARKKLKDKSEANSILGKMCMNFTGICSGQEVKILLVSNIAFEFADHDICASALDDKYRQKIKDKLLEEIPSLTDDQFNRLHFMISGVSIDKMQTYLNGQAMELFKAHFGEEHGLNVHSWVRLIQGDIARKNSHPSDEINTVADLISKKCIDRSYVTNTLAIVAKSKRTIDMSLVNNELGSSGWSAVDLIRLGKVFPEATYDYTDASNAVVGDIIFKLEDFFAEMDGDSIDLSSFCKNSVDVIVAAISHPYNNKIYLTALAILVFYEKV